MKKGSNAQTYAYLICIVCLIVGGISVYNGIYGMIKIILPSLMKFLFGF